MNYRLASLLIVLVSPLARGEEQPTSEQAAFFEAKIRPVLVESCFECHSADKKIKGGLQLDTRAGMRHGGDSGEVIVPGDPDGSLLYTAITWADEEYEMPPKKKLPAGVIADFRKWIEMGAPDPRKEEAVVHVSEIDLVEGRKFWSFQKPGKAAPPAVVRADWPVSEVDRFVLARLEENGLAPAADASPEVLLRRLYFDLIGLPPTVEEIHAYAKAWRADAEKAYREKVEELLARPQFGERWGRHWLDVARYAESTGKEINMTLPHAWRYRDYVIDSFNEDKRYDRFVQEQIAGDLLKIGNDAEWQENLIATGFLALGPKGLNERNPRQFALDLADEQLDVTTQAILGLTVSCARCHDHKSDPIPTTDYYAMAGIFQNTKTFFGTVNVQVNRRGTKLLELPLPDASPVQPLRTGQMEEIRERLADAEEELEVLRKEARPRAGEGPPANLQQLQRVRSSIAQLRARLDGLNPDGSAKALAMGVQDFPRPVEPLVLIRGELDKPAQKVKRGFLQVLDGMGTPPALPKDGSGRLELAQWLTSEENPLTARVMVNRIWQKLFGQGIVPSTSNFGATGQAPSHPELLDYLAVRFMEEEWSVKSVIRELLMTRTYRMSSGFNQAAYGKDPDNVLWWRATPRRLDAEALRDAMLVASGSFDADRPYGSIVAEAGDTAIGGRLGVEALSPPVRYRSVYLPFARDALPESLALFDPADPNLVAGEREASNVPGQALYLMNNPFVMQQGEAMAERLGREAETPRERLALAFQICYGRVATNAELSKAEAYLWNFTTIAGKKEGAGAEQAGRLALASFCQGLLASAEFRYLN